MTLCHSGNKYKETIWHNKGQRKVLNVHLDKEPKEQYLFCDILIEHGIPIGKYKIDGSLVTDKLLFQTIESTFSNLHLIDSYNIIANSNNKSVLMDLIKQMQKIRKFSEKTNLECKDLLLNELNLEPINKKEIVFKKALLNDSSSLLYIFGEIDKYLAL